MVHSLYLHVLCNIINFRPSHFFIKSAIIHVLILIMLISYSTPMTDICCYLLIKSMHIGQLKLIVVSCRARAAGCILMTILNLLKSYQQVRHYIQLEYHKEASSFSHQYTVFSVFFCYMLTIHVHAISIAHACLHCKQFNVLLSLPNDDCMHVPLQQ